MARRRKSKSKPRISEKKFPPLKPVVLSDAEAEMFRRHDYIGLESYYCDIIRRKKSPSPEQRAKLTVHDREEARVARDPKAALREARESIDRGVSMLLKLIRGRTLTYVIEPTEKGKAAGVKTRSWDEAMECLLSRSSDLNRQLARLAEDNAPKACWHLWFEAKALADTFTRLAILHSEEFRDIAEGSLTMPSLRARNPKFTADAAAIIDAIHLGEKHPSPGIWDNKSRVGALCHLVVASLIERIHDARREYAWEAESIEGLKQFHETANRYRGVSVRQVLKSRLHPHLFEHVVACADLPEWGKDPHAWWKGRILPLVKETFEELAKNPRRNPALWDELERGGERNTQNDMRRYMEKLCKNKFDQVVKASQTKLPTESVPTGRSDIPN